MRADYSEAIVCGLMALCLSCVAAALLQHVAMIVASVSILGGVAAVIWIVTISE